MTTASSRPLKPETMAQVTVWEGWVFEHLRAALADEEVRDWLAAAGARSFFSTRGLVWISRAATGG
jgi:hypothetical protein